MSAIRIRLAANRHLSDLVRLETIGFEKDRFTEEQIEYLLTRAHASIFIAEIDGAIVGAAYMLWRKALTTGRLYNIVTDPGMQGKGIGGRLLQECELEAAYRGIERVTLEVRVDNTGAIGFYEKHGYTHAATMSDYYADGTTGLRMVKPVTQKVPDSVRLRIPYYHQTLEFTCGPASLLMALAYFDSGTVLSRVQEITLWKEATLVFMTSGVGGTGPYGLALAAADRGYSVRMLTSTDQAPFVKSVRAPQKREVIRLIHEDMRAKAQSLGISTATYNFAIEDLTSMIHRGRVPIVLISTYRLTGDRSPHWVVVTGFDDKNIYIHDPDIESYRGRSERARNIAIPRREFQKMSRYGTDSYRCAVIVGKR